MSENLRQNNFNQYGKIFSCVMKTLFLNSKNLILDYFKHFMFLKQVLIIEKDIFCLVSNWAVDSRIFLA